MRISGPVIATLGFCLAAGDGLAQPNYPTKPVRLIVPFPPGGQTDVVARALSQKLGDVFGQSVVVDNRPGAAGSIGVDIAVKSPGDGYTMVMVSTSYAANVALYKLTYDPVNDIVPVVMVGEIGNMVTVNPSGPFRSARSSSRLRRRIPEKSTSPPVAPAAATTLPPNTSPSWPASP